MTHQLKEHDCRRCGQPITTTRGFITQQWDLTPIKQNHMFWVAIFRSPVLAVTQLGTSWQAQLDRDHIDIPTRRDTATTWLPGHRCRYPPIPDADLSIKLTPPPPVAVDLFNQPTHDDLPPY